MTEPSQYFKGRTVQEQMNEVIGYVDQRSAEVATAAIASDVAQVHQDKLDADADAQAAAASAAAAAGTLANAVKKTGEASQNIAGNIAVAGTLSGGVVTGTQVTVPAPVNNTDAATKKYVDDADALKADKTYVDAQDALKINITDIDQYAVGLTGNQTKSGIVTFVSPQEGTWNGHRMSFGAISGNWYKIGEIVDLTSTYTVEVLTWIINTGYYNSSKGGVAMFSLIIPHSGTIEGFIPIYKSNDALVWSNFSIKIGKKADGTIEVFGKGRDYTSYFFNPISLLEGARNIAAGNIIMPATATIVPEPQTADYDQLITVTI